MASLRSSDPDDDYLKQANPRAWTRMIKRYLILNIIFKDIILFENYSRSNIFANGYDHDVKRSILYRVF